MKKQKDDLVHLRFDYVDALNSVRDILYMQRSLMMMAKKLREYNSLKKEENKIKLKLHDKTSDAKRILNKLQKALPKVKSPKVVKVHEERKIGEIRDDGNIEQQLQDIQKRLGSLANQKF